MKHYLETMAWTVLVLAFLHLVAKLFAYWRDIGPMLGAYVFDAFTLLGLACAILAYRRSK